MLMMHLSGTPPSLRLQGISNLEAATPEESTSRKPALRGAWLLEQGSGAPLRDFERVH